MPEYQAQEGQEDPHGEITGAITVNMVLCMPPVTVWCVFIGPWLLGDALGWILGIGLVMGVALPLSLLPVSRWIWAHMSAWADQPE